MTGRERLLKSFRQEPVDRIPVSPFIYNNFIKAFYKDTDADIILGTVEVYRHFDFDIMHRNINVRYDESCLDSPEWVVKKSEYKKGNSTIVTTMIKTPERVLTQVVRYEDLDKYNRVKAVVEFFIKDEEDFQQFVKYQPSMPQMEFQDLNRAKKAIGDDGITAPWVSGVFNYLSDLRKLDDLIIDALINPTFYNQMMEYFLKRIINHIGQIVKAGVDVLSYAGNIASGTFVGPVFFRKHIFEYEKLLIDSIQDKGVYVLYHNCGDGNSMIEVYNELGMRGYESITEPPYGDNDLKDAVTRFSKNITLIGNIDQITFLRSAKPDEVKLKAWEKLEIVGDRKGFILGTSDFIIEDTPHENLFALASIK
jgi:uroporphyrinogen decarboxylase